MKIRVVLLTAVFFALTVMPACQQGPYGLNDGYYTAEAASFDNDGWKEYVLIYVSQGRIITVEYDAFNESGFIKSWDHEYMREMNEAAGTYPNEYMRAYAISLVNSQDPRKVDAVTGATQSHINFQMLAEAAIESAKAGDKQVAVVELPEQ